MLERRGDGRFEDDGDCRISCLDMSMENSVGVEEMRIYEDSAYLANSMRASVAA